MTNRRKRVFGDKISFKSLSCAPVNEPGVVYLFGVLHDTLDLKIESIQAGFPDCIARRKIKNNRWEEVRIEFEFESKSFKAHGHDPNRADMIVCWNHNWKNCPDKTTCQKCLAEFEVKDRLEYIFVDHILQF